jgi:hypothetical protein
VKCGCRRSRASFVSPFLSYLDANTWNKFWNKVGRRGCSRPEKRTQFGANEPLISSKNYSWDTMMESYGVCPENEPDKPQQGCRRTRMSGVIGWKRYGSKS